MKNLIQSVTRNLTTKDSKDKMTKDSKQQPNWRKMFWLVVLVVVVGYAFGEPHLEKWLGVDLPSIREQSDQGNVATVDSDAKNEARSNPGTRDSNSKNSQGAWSSNSNPTKGDKVGRKSAGDKSYLTPTGKKNRLRSPAGLIYGVGGGGEHRVDHVMRHADDMPSRPVHSVFSGSRDEILKTIDEAYELVKAKSNRVRSRPDKERGYRIEHVIDMKRKIGYLGGKRGKRENHPPRSKLTLVLDNGKFVVTAYPDR